MEKTTFKQNIKTKLISAAESYSILLNKKISINLPNQNTYIIRFYETNFLHLTGVKTNLSTLDFYQKCKNKTISYDEYDCDSLPIIKGLVRLKMKNLINIGKFFNNKVLVQESFQKGLIKCVIASSDGKCTLGFADAKYCVRPQTILDKNHLNRNRPIYLIKPKIIDIL